jgi:5-methylcytosine-specific restriction endonuclease McrA
MIKVNISKKLYSIIWRTTNFNNIILDVVLCDRCNKNLTKQSFRYLEQYCSDCNNFLLEDISF